MRVEYGEALRVCLFCYLEKKKNAKNKNYEKKNLIAHDFLIKASRIAFLCEGLVGEASGYPPVNGGPLHVHERSAIRGDARTSHRGVDAEDTISAAQRHRILRVPDIHDSAHRTSGLSHHSR